MARPIDVFRPIDQSTVTLGATSSSGRVALPLSASEYRIINGGAENAYFRFGDSSVTATVPSGATGGSTPIAAAATETFRPPINAPTHIAAITGSGSVTLYVTAGEGL